MRDAMKYFENENPYYFCRDSQCVHDFCQRTEAFFRVDGFKAMRVAARLFNDSKLGHNEYKKMLLNNLSNLTSSSYVFLWCDDNGKDFVLENLSEKDSLAFERDLITLLKRDKQPMKAELLRTLIEAGTPTEVVMGKFYTEDDADELIDCMLEKQAQIDAIVCFDPLAWTKIGVDKALRCGAGPYILLECVAYYPFYLQDKDIEAFIDAGIDSNYLLWYLLFRGHSEVRCFARIIVNRVVTKRQEKE